MRGQKVQSFVLCKKDKGVGEMERYSGNNAYRIRLKEREERRLERRDNPKYERYIAVQKKKIIGAMLIIMAAALAIILRYAQISVLNTQEQKAMAALEEARTTQSNLEIERDRCIDLVKIEDIAVHEYGMIKPMKDQVVYITVARANTVKVAGRTYVAGINTEIDS